MTGLGDARRIAFCMSNHIGDTLVSMVVVRQLVASGRSVTVFGTPAHALRRWFPGFVVLSLPPAGSIRQVLAGFDLVIQMHVHQPYAVSALGHERVVTLQSVECGPGQGCMAERFAAFCRQAFGLPDTGIANGLTPPSALQPRGHAGRVVIHPEANAEDKRWLKQRFLRVAAALQRRGHEVVFVVAPHERHRWNDLASHGFAAPQWNDLDALAAFVYESGGFIGNDSGVGHLASNLGVPTVSLFRRRSVAERWRPAWGTVTVVLPWQWVPSAYLKERLWRQTLTCGRVLRAFDRLQSRA